MTNKLVENRNLCVVVLFPQVILIELFLLFLIPQEEMNSSDKERQA